MFKILAQLLKQQIISGHQERPVQQLLQFSSLVQHVGDVQQTSKLSSLQLASSGFHNMRCLRSLRYLWERSLVKRPTTEELNQVKTNDEREYETYQKLMHHFHIYVEVLGMRIQGVGQKHGPTTSSLTQITFLLTLPYTKSCFCQKMNSLSFLLIKITTVLNYNQKKENPRKYNKEDHISIIPIYKGGILIVAMRFRP